MNVHWPATVVINVDLTCVIVHILRTEIETISSYRSSVTFKPHLHGTSGKVHYFISEKISTGYEYGGKWLVMTPTNVQEVPRVTSFSDKYYFLNCIVQSNWGKYLSIAQCKTIKGHFINCLSTIRHYSDP